MDVTIANQAMIRENNRKRVLEAVICHPSISRAALTHQTGLTGGTITAIVQLLLEEQLLEEVGTTVGGKGRRRLMLRLKAESACCIAVTIGKPWLRLMECDLGGSSRQKSQCPASYHSPEAFFQTLFAFVDPYLEQDYPLGIGAIVLAVEGDLTETEVSFSGLTLSRQQLCQQLQAAWGTPVWMEHVSRLSALGENAYAMKCQNMAYLHAENSMGLGLIVDGKLFCGRYGRACNIGQMLLSAQQPFCQLASVPALLKNHDFDDFASFLVAYQAQMPAAMETAHDFLSYYALLIQNIFSLYDTERLVIHCPFTTRTDALFLQLKQRLGPLKSRLYRSFLQEDAPLLGGAVLGLCQFLRIESFVPLKGYGVL